MPGKRRTPEEMIKIYNEKIKALKQKQALGAKKEDKKWLKIDPKIGSFVREAFQNNFEGMTLDNLKAEIKKMIEQRKPGAKRGPKAKGKIEPKAKRAYNKKPKAVVAENSNVAMASGETQTME